MLFEKILFGYGNSTIDILDSKNSNNPYQGMMKPGGIMNVAKGWKALSQLQRKIPVKFYMIGYWGSDEYSEVIKTAIEKDGFDTRFFRRLPNSESRVYRIELTNSEAPDIQRFKEGEMLQSTSNIDIIPFLTKRSLLFTQSFAKYLESPQAEETIQTYAIARGLDAETANDFNIRQASLDVIQGKGKAVSPTEVEERQRMMISRKESGLRQLTILKLNKVEAKVLMNDFKTEKPLKEITVEESELPKMADSIMSTYDKLRMLAITNGKNGGYFMTRDYARPYKAVILTNPINSLGCGDGFSAAMTFGRVVRLYDAEIAALAPIFAAFYTQVSSGYPDHLTPNLIEKAILDNTQFCKDMSADSNNILVKLKNPI
jgi:sugar/nucleoside kinase (ribokinase family)